MIFTVTPVTTFVAHATETSEVAKGDLPSNAIAINSAWELSMICNEYPAYGYYYLTTDIDLSSDVAENGVFYEYN